MPPALALERLRRQREHGQELLRKPDLSSEEGNTWYNTTLDVVMRAFGSGHRNVLELTSAGIELINSHPTPGASPYHIRYRR
jgi:hypothetical protein